MVLRIRFHGRGGQGVKTASRIVGTAAFLVGYQVQDSPVYGAERRGAAVVAFTRFGEEAILERGVIEHPDLIVVGDETLLANPAAGVMVGQETATAIFLNAESAQPLVEQYALSPSTIAWDLTRRTQAIVGVASALSVGLAAATARLVGLIPEAQLLSAVRRELMELHLPEGAIAKNLDLASEVFNALPSLEFPLRDGQETPQKISSVLYEGLLRGSPSILNTGNAEQRQTGAWRLERPEVNFEQCTRCGLCFLQCPDGAITLDQNGYPIIDYDHCKGCMLCQTLCPVQAILSKQEVRSW
ncbi:MAG: 2-oxoacid:acceptor oxidoreductase family protein [Leptolyngbyaceae cyanobacterium MO_188.B28]|nr:2-oxoacid:acceptor oxidoreductase family protein [Leptolyngbyaceae cyanobacterium MO_188.B28]